MQEFDTAILVYGDYRPIVLFVPQGIAAVSVFSHLVDNTAVKELLAVIIQHRYLYPISPFGLDINGDGRIFLHHRGSLVKQ